MKESGQLSGDLVERSDRGLPLTRAQLDIWLAQQTGHFDVAWQLGVLVRIEGAVDRALFERAMRHVVGEAESLRARFFEVDGQVFQKAIEDPDVDLAFYDLCESPDPEREVRQRASAIQRTPMPLTGPMINFYLFQTAPDEYYWFTCCHHIAIDGLGIALLGRRIAAVYSALASGTAISPAFFGSLRDLVDSELEYAASPEYAEDQAYWADHLPSPAEPDYRFTQAASERDPTRPLRQSIGRVGGRPHQTVVQNAGHPPVVGPHRCLRAVGAWVPGREFGRSGARLPGQPSA